MDASAYNRVLPDAKLLCPTVSAKELQQLSPVALAYLGDAVYELFVRQQFLLPSQQIRAYHQQVVGQVRAEAQAVHLGFLLPYLTHSEQDILRRGRNAATPRSRRVAPEIYQQASSFETLIGYLYLTDQQRLFDLLSLLQLFPPPSPPS
jgi:ribonuclease-3 family protein